MSPIMDFGTFGGMRVLESLFLEQDGEPIEVRRTWRERLFTLPWRPLKVTRTVIPRVPYRGVLQLNPNTLVVHPAMLNEIRRFSGPHREDTPT